MLCPKCKTEISQTAIRCSNCGAKVRSKCPSCGLLNKVNALTCSKCNHELLRKCPSCGSYNLPTAKKCRKCEHSLIVRLSKNNDADNTAILAELEQAQNSQPKIEEQIKPKVTAKKETLEMEEKGEEIKPFSEQEIPQPSFPVKSQNEIKSLAVNSLMNSSDYIFSALIANEGYGKSYVLNQIKEDLTAANITVLAMEATPVTQLSPFGLFQDLFLTSLNLANYFVDGQQKETDFVLTKNDMD